MGDKGREGERKEPDVLICWGRVERPGSRELGRREGEKMPTLVPICEL